MVLYVPCGDTAIRVYERPSKKPSTSKVEYRAEFCERTGTVSKSPPGKRLWGAWATSIRSTVASLLLKVKLEQEQIDAVWANEQIVSEVLQPAMSHKSHTPVAYTATVANTGEAGATWPGGLFEGFGPTCLQTAALMKI